jgi:WD40 repeat protein
MRATPCVYDWDQDGLPDLLCGAGDGYVYFFKNTNTATAPIFAPATRIKAGGSDLYLSMRSVVRVFDWDGDGLNDLVCSSSSGVYWCRNTNSNAQPILQAAQAISAPVAALGLRPINTGARMRLDLVDWNNDGVIDLLLGNADGTVYYYQGYRFRIRGPFPQAGNLIALQWDSAPYLSYNVLAGASVTSITNLAATNLPSGGITTAWTNSAAEAQQFYRLQIAQ